MNTIHTIQYNPKQDFFLIHCHINTHLYNASNSAWKSLTFGRCLLDRVKHLTDMSKSVLSSLGVHTPAALSANRRISPDGSMFSIIWLSKFLSSRLRLKDGRPTTQINNMTIDLNHKYTNQCHAYKHR